MNNRILYPVILLVGLVIGMGVGTLTSKAKIDEQKEVVEKQKGEISRLETQMQTEKTDSEGIIRKAETEIAQNKNELARMKSLVTLTTTQLAKANAELREIKSRNQESPTISPEVTEPVVVITTPSRDAGTASTTGTIDYTIEDGDSFWKIAQEQLGDGLRYKEILKLNPDMSENQALIIGTIIKIPAR